MKRKKRIIILVSVCVVVLIGAIIFDVVTSKSYLKEIKYDDLIEKINNKESFVLLISQTTCTHCKNYKPLLKDVANSNEVMVYYVEFDLFTNEQQTAFNKLFNFDGTPTTIFVKDGVEETTAGRINGLASKDKIIAKFKSNGIIQ